MQAVEIPLSKEKVALISPEDAERVLAFKWCYHGEGYAARGVHFYVDGKRHTRIILLHRFIANAPDGYDVDHRDGNGLDCRRHNLRVATRVQNIANSGPRAGKSSQYKGVQFIKKTGRWRATIGKEGRTIYLGMFDCESDAALAYDAAAFAAWGEFAYLNFPQHRDSYLLALTIQRAASSVRWFSLATQ